MFCAGIQKIEEKTTPVLQETERETASDFERSNGTHYGLQEKWGNIIQSVNVSSAQVLIKIFWHYDRDARATEGQKKAMQKQGQPSIHYLGSFLG